MRPNAAAAIVKYALKVSLRLVTLGFACSLSTCSTACTAATSAVVAAVFSEVILTVDESKRVASTAPEESREGI